MASGQVPNNKPLAVETTLDNDEWSSILKDFDEKQVKSYLGDPVKALGEALEQYWALFKRFGIMEASIKQGSDTY